MAKPIVTKQSMIESLNTLSDEKVIQYVGRALVAIFRNQTDNEKVENQTNHTNDIGFSSSDAKDGCITAKYFIKHGTLLGWMLDNWTRDWRGAPRITKYHRQLNEVAMAKAARAAKAKMKPNFKHDTDEHEFVGHTTEGHDVWYGRKFDEVIVRFGNEGPEYRAMPFGQAKSMQSYVEAVSLATKSRGF